MIKRTKISEDVADVLARATVDGNVLKLPEQLERKHYLAVDKFLKALGGKWNRKLGGHEFVGEVDGALANALENAVVTGEFVDEKREYQAFWTPAPVAEILLEEADLLGASPGGRVLEPEVGIGQLGTYIRDRILGEEMTLICVEINEGYAFSAREKELYVEIADFLNWAPRYQRTFDRIVANPPFTGRQDVMHALAMYGCLIPGGRMVSVMSAGSMFVRDGEVMGREDKLTVELRELVKAYGHCEMLPENSFKESGTGVRASYIVINKE